MGSIMITNNPINRTRLDATKLALPLGKLRHGWTPSRIGSAVLECSTELKRARPGTLPAIQRQMGRAAEQLRSADLACRALPREAWAFAAPTTIEAVEELLCNLTILTTLVTQAREIAADEVKHRLAHQGGRPTDPRLKSFVRRLATVFEESTGGRPTSTKAPMTGELKSAFDKFTLEALRQLWPGRDFPGDAEIASAIRNVVGDERDLEQFDPPKNDVDAIGSSNPPSR